MTTSEGDESIVAATVTDPFLSARQIRNELRLRNMSIATIRRCLHAAGLHSRIVAQKVLLEVNHKKRHLVVSAVESWSEQNWQAVTFTDEASFTTRWEQQRKV